MSLGPQNLSFTAFLLLSVPSLHFLFVDWLLLPMSNCTSLWLDVILVGPHGTFSMAGQCHGIPYFKLLRKTF